jgi:hypothetical protein
LEKSQIRIGKEMDMCRAGNSFNRRSRVFGSRLPPGVRDADCERPPSPLADAGENQLWRICGPQEQERMSSHFVERNAELLRDAILDAGESSASPGSSERGREILLGGLLWPAWICFRDRALRELRRDGEFPKI